MCDAIAHPVERLRRTRIGTITASGLKPGELRDLTAAEIRALQGQKAEDKRQKAEGKGQKAEGRRQK